MARHTFWIAANLFTITSRPPHSASTFAILYTSSLSTVLWDLLFKVSMNSSVASPRRPRIRYTTRMASWSPPSATQICNEQT